MKRSRRVPNRPAPKLTIRPLTPDRWPDLEDLFGKKGACNGCWCMYWRIGAAYRGHGESNRRAFRNIVRKGPPPGLLAYEGGVAVGWCQLTPRDDLPGISAALITATIRAARPGFRVVLRRTRPQPIVRYDLTREPVARVAATERRVKP